MPALTVPRRVFLTADAVGGVWTHAVTLASGLAARGVEVTLAVLGPPPTAAQARAAGACTLLHTGLPLDWAGADAAALRAAGARLAALASGADLVHLNSPALAAGGAFRAPLVIGCHSCVATWWEAARGGPLPPDLAWQRDLTAAGYAAADALVAPSAAFAEATRSCHGLSRAPHVVPNGLVPGGPAAEGPRGGIIAAGRLWDEAKNIALLDRIAPRLGAPIAVAGPLAAPGGGAARFANLHHLGVLDAAAMRAQFAAAAVFVAPARYEPFGLAVLEAAQAGCALLLSDIPSFREIWGDAADHAAPTGEDAFLARLRQLLDDPARARRRGAEARRRAERYTQDAMTDGMLSLYGEVLAGQAAA